jgi:DNA-directed RNA polymerase subunit RPC12/RpoP
MPFIVQCANAECRKYNLVEDEMRGRKVQCLICKTAFRAETAVRVCPQCSAKMGVPANVAAQRVQCPKCGTVFQ